MTVAVATAATAVSWAEAVAVAIASLRAASSRAFPCCHRKPPPSRTSASAPAVSQTGHRAYQGGPADGAVAGTTTEIVGPETRVASGAAVDQTSTRTL